MPKKSWAVRTRLPLGRDRDAHDGRSRLVRDVPEGRASICAGRAGALLVAGMVNCWPNETGARSSREATIMPTTRRRETDENAVEN